MVIAKFRSQLSISRDQVSARLRPAENVLDQLQRRGANWLREVREDFTNDCRRLGPDSRHMLIIANEALARLGSRVFAASKHVTMKLQRAQNAVSGSAGSIAFNPREIRRSHGTSGYDLPNLMASSHDPVAVTDGNRRFVAANAKALELFGISEVNMRNFTLDAFVASVELPDFHWSNRWPKGRQAKLNRCKIRRLDGGLLVAECQFVAGVVPHRHLCKFLNVAPYKITPLSCAKRNLCAASQADRRKPIEFGAEKTGPAKKIPVTRSTRL